MPTLAELLAKQAALEKQIAEARRAERGEAITRIRALMTQYGLTLADLGKPGAASAAPVPARKTRKGVPLGKVAPRYRDSASGQTWSGRGLKPKWLVAALAAGHTLDEFRL
jgi:DNA-binding protein H-NS